MPSLSEGQWSHTHTSSCQNTHHSAESPNTITSHIDIYIASNVGLLYRISTANLSVTAPSTPSVYKEPERAGSRTGNDFNWRNAEPNFQVAWAECWGREILKTFFWIIDNLTKCKTACEICLGWSGGAINTQLGNRPLFNCCFLLAHCFIRCCIHIA